ncbi:hypothetical protein EG68_11116 [Paragonimus skrjabini miyazakii]|uniref:Uncharacterized protein n=1 Tax=Paragonimus skrjabini miyazakii TaxID=59628 RepID=A0A8S9YIU6_9TREM|nr:hypothetical protein EG68_11116 [Paragonimus skrjabini miyazakii]
MSVCMYVLLYVLWENACSRLRLSDVVNWILAPYHFPFASILSTTLCLCSDDPPQRKIVPGQSPRSVPPRSGSITSRRLFWIRKKPVKYPCRYKVAATCEFVDCDTFCGRMDVARLLEVARNMSWAPEVENVSLENMWKVIKEGLIVLMD